MISKSKQGNTSLPKHVEVEPRTSNVRVNSACTVYAFPIVSAFLVAIQASFIWLTRFPSADNLIETIAAQLFISQGKIFVYYPGQAHGGMLELPLQIAILNVFSGDFLLATLPRIVFATLTGYFLAKIYALLFPTHNKIWFLLSLFFAPALLRDLWMFGGGYSLSWTLQLIAVYLLISSPKAFSYTVAGVLISLAFYEQPSSLFLFMLFIPFILNTFPFNLRRIRYFVFGFLPLFFLGLVARAFPVEVVYNPISASLHPNRILGSIGLTQNGPANPSLIHNALGLINGPTPVSWPLQLYIVGLFVLSTVSLLKVRGSSPTRLLGFSWFLGVIGISALTSVVVTDSWFYGLSISVFVPFATAIIINSISRLEFRIFLCALLILNFFIVPSALKSANLLEIVSAHKIVKSHASNLVDFSLKLQSRDVKYAYGSYDEVYPIMIASSSKIIGIPKTFNRFKPLLRESLNSGGSQKIIVTEADVEFFNNFKNCAEEPKSLIYLEGAKWYVYSCSSGVITSLFS
jgi:hypothetical protein